MTQQCWQGSGALGKAAKAVFVTGATAIWQYCCAQAGARGQAGALVRRSTRPSSRGVEVVAGDAQARLAEALFAGAEGGGDVTVIHCAGIAASPPGSTRTFMT